MKVVRKLFPAAILCSIVLMGGSAAAQSRPPSIVEQPSRDLRWTEVGSHVAGEQGRLLEEALERYRDIERRGGWDKVPTDLVMGSGYSYDCWRIVGLERRLIAEGYLSRAHTPPPPPPLPPGAQPPDGEPPTRQEARCEYGPALTAAMRDFQADRKVLGVGQLGSRTMVELNRPVQEIVEILEHDVARWRDVSLDPSGTYLLVNIPFFELSLYEGGRESMRMQVIVGQPTWQTPLFSDEIEYIILNPDWGIPDSIAKQEYLPTARRDSGYLRRQGITASPGGLRQKPGPHNPLGRIKFVMPNRLNVYLHDTPEKRAFSAAVRALSHGCIRLGDPDGLANYLLRDQPQWNPRRLQAAIASGHTQQINLNRHMPVHIVYSTSRVNQEGRVELRPDVYGKNKNPLPPDEHLPRPEDEDLGTWP